MEIVYILYCIIRYNMVELFYKKNEINTQIKIG